MIIHFHRIVVVNLQIIILYFFTLLISAFFFSCKSDKVFDTPLKHFEQTPSFKLTVVRSIDLEKYDVYKPGMAMKFKEGYLIKEMIDKNMMSYINLSNDMVVKGVNKGEAPGEIISVSSRFQKLGENYFIYEQMRKQVLQVNIDIDANEITVSEYRKVNIPRRPFKTCVLSDGIISAGITDNGWLESYDNNYSLVSVIPYPDFEETKNLTMIEKGAIYLSSSIVPSPDYSRLVAAPQDVGVISFIKLDGNRMEEYKRLMYHPPMVTAPRTEGSPAIAYSRDGIVTFLDIVCDDDFVMALYSGRTSNSHGTWESSYCEYVLVYDWEGNPVKYFTLEKPLISFGYDREHKTLYGVGYDPEGMIFEYDLNDVYSCHSADNRPNKYLMPFEQPKPVE